MLRLPSTTPYSRLLTSSPCLLFSSSVPPRINTFVSAPPSLPSLFSLLSYSDSPPLFILSSFLLPLFLAPSLSLSLSFSFSFSFFLFLSPSNPTLLVGKRAEQHLAEEDPNHKVWRRRR